MVPSGIGSALVLVAVGAILRYAVEYELAGVDIGVVGLILMILGIVLILITLLVHFSGRRPLP